jgi:hypothetical protein
MDINPDDRRQNRGNRAEIIALKSVGGELFDRSGERYCPPIGKLFQNERYVRFGAYPVPNNEFIGDSESTEF